MDSLPRQYRTNIQWASQNSLWLAVLVQAASVEAKLAIVLIQVASVESKLAIVFTAFFLFGIGSGIYKLAIVITDFRSYLCLSLSSTYIAFDPLRGNSRG